MVLDKLIGPKVLICVTRFLPTRFLGAFKLSPEAAVSMRTLSSIGKRIPDRR